METEKLIRWTFYHGLVLLVASLFAVLTQSTLLVLVTAMTSFIWISLTLWGHWTEEGGVGLANVITIFRLVGTIGLGFLAHGLSNAVIGLAGVTLFALDGADGLVARRLNQASEFGEYLDKEADAFFILVLCLVAIFKEVIGSWILILGLLRYGFVVIRHLIRPEIGGERKSVVARWIAGFVMVSLLACFSPWPAVYKPLALIATVLLALSFTRDFQWMYLSNQR